MLNGPQLESLLLEIKSSLDRISDEVRMSRAPSEFLSTQEVATLCGVHKNEVLRWKSVGLPAYDMGKGFRFRRSEVLNFTDSLKMKAEAVHD